MLRNIQHIKIRILIKELLGSTSFRLGSMLPIFVAVGEILYKTLGIVVVNVVMSFYCDFSEE